MGRKKEILLIEDDEKEVYFISKKSMGCRFFVGTLLLLTAVTACFAFGYYCGFMFSENNSSQDFGVFSETDPNTYLIGVARKDVTGPIVQVNMMGYANPAQIANGLHQRLYARSFIVDDGKSRVCFVTVDSGMGSQIIKLEVIKKLKEKFGETYNERNVVISGTHSHSGPAGFFQTLLPEVTSLGAIKQTTDSFVRGIVDSIEAAHSGMKKGTITFAMERVQEGNINRSPYSYQHDPEDERAKYQHNTGQELSMLKFTSSEGEAMGQFNWFPVHGTSMNSTNGLISSDNKGRASALFEQGMRKQGEMLTGQESFVAAFASANLGDVSPNTKGAKCISTGKSCDLAKSTCGFPPRVQDCIAFGPGGDMFQSTDIIAKRQVEAAKLAYNSKGMQVNGSVGFAHQYVDMSKEVVHLEDGSNVTTCKPGMGYSFAAGTTDGPGAFDFTQAMTEGTLLWNTVRDKVIVPVVCSEKPPQSYYDCHHPKPVLLPTGYMDRPYAWHPHIIDVQMLKIGQVFVVAVPGEFTTMAGRRIKETISEEAAKHDIKNPRVVLAGLSNVYTHYITTPEEYKVQRYEGGSTIFGPHTFQAYQQKFASFVQLLVDGKQPDESGPVPDNILDRQIELLPPPLADSVPDGVHFGAVVSDARSEYKAGEVASVTFYGANPRHNVKQGDTFLKVQRQIDNTTWLDVYTDTDWETRFRWEEKVRFGDDGQPIASSVAGKAPTERNVLTNMFELIGATSGVNFDYEQALVGNMDLGARGEPNHNLFAAVAAVETSSTSGEATTSSAKPKLLGSTAESHVTVEWWIGSGEKSGTYRLVYTGDRMDPETGVVSAISGTSRSFTVKP